MKIADLLVFRRAGPRAVRDEHLVLRATRHQGLRRAGANHAAQDEQQHCRHHRQTAFLQNVRFFGFFSRNRNFAIRRN